MKLVLFHLSKSFLNLILDKDFAEERHGILLGKDVSMDGYSDMDKPRKTLNLNSLVMLYFKFNLRKIQDKYKSRHYNHRSYRVLKSEGNVPSNDEQLKVNFWGLKAAKSDEELKIFQKLKVVRMV